jgi:epoxyqueuosine reductase
VALGNRGELGAAPALARTLAADPEPLVRAHAAWALGEIGRRGVDVDGAATEELRRALGGSAHADADDGVRVEALAALGRATWT